METKARVFFRLLGPLILHANELIQAERQPLQSFIEGLRTGKMLIPSEQTFSIETAVAYMHNLNTYLSYETLRTRRVDDPVDPGR